jgi:hypothetical protein
MSFVVDVKCKPDGINFYIETFRLKRDDAANCYHIEIMHYLLG